VLGTLALEGDQFALLRQRVGDRFPPDDEREQRALRQRSRARSRLGNGSHIGLTALRRSMSTLLPRLPPRERWQIIEGLREVHQVGLGRLPLLGCVIEHGRRVRDAARHGIEPQHARPGAKRVELSPELVPDLAGARLRLERREQAPSVRELSSERGDEVSACSPELRSLGFRRFRACGRRLSAPGRNAGRLRFGFAGHFVELPRSGRAR
jgi:hypothetical protein